ncbi:hypothetical protein [Ochrobactrum sp. Marseille-Q0166]|uniref:hypothetical protein n=1 Tax=Ochrobactrum sp. Marseille-Q0166 TaxID=2761105 RepID=UPI0016567DD8|nr:hypothetical protein [Ochrobactrum sp. Marseille-Q0166]MBC8718199.1 hypothetical protein [Ochrobactrum sp. Marseille-Q0166]
MSEKKLFLHLKIKQDVPTYRAISAVMTDALRVTLENMAKNHKDLEWLDELEKTLIYNAKSFITEGVAIDEEAESFGVAIQVLQGVIGATRASLTDKQ